MSNTYIILIPRLDYQTTSDYMPLLKLMWLLLLSAWFMIFALLWFGGALNYLFFRKVQQENLYTIIDKVMLAAGCIAGCTLLYYWVQDCINELGQEVREFLIYSVIIAVIIFILLPICVALRYEQVGTDALVLN